MKKLILKALSLEGFRSFVEKQTLQFPENGLVLVRANGSGTGKSSLFLAISYALQSCPYPTTELQSWYTKTPLKVSLNINDTEIIRAAKGSTNNLSSTVEINPDLLSALTYRPQKSPGLFLSKTNSEMQEFLTVLLGLEKYEEGIETSKSKIDNLNIQVATTQRELDNANVVLSEVLKEVEEPIADTNQYKQLIIDEEAILNDALRALEEERNRYEKSLREVDSRRTILQNTWQAKIKELKDAATLATSQLAKKTSDTSDKAKYLESVINEIERRIQAENVLIENYKTHKSIAENELRSIHLMEEELPQLLNNKCPRCDQTFIEDKDTIDTYRARVDSKQKFERELEKIAEAIMESEENLSKLRTLHNQSTNQLGEIRAVFIADNKIREANNNSVINEHKALIANATADFNHELNVFDKKNAPLLEAQERAVSLHKENVVKLDAQLKIKREHLKQIDILNDRATVQNKKLRERKSKAQQNVSDIEVKLATLKTALSLEMDLLELTKQFLTAIFDEVLAEIATYTNQMLSNIANVAHIQIGFHSETSTLKGTIKRAIKPYVFIGEEERPLRSALSGGMLTALELATDLAVRQVILNRTGIKPGWLILDECFEGLPSKEKEACMQLLHHVSTDTLIMVVDHDTEFKEMFNQTIDIQYENGKSKIVAIT